MDILNIDLSSYNPHTLALREAVRDLQIIDSQIAEDPKFLRNQFRYQRNKALNLVIYLQNRYNEEDLKLKKELGI